MGMLYCACRRRVKTINLLPTNEQILIIMEYHCQLNCQDECEHNYSVERCHLPLMRRLLLLFEFVFPCSSNGSKQYKVHVRSLIVFVSATNTMFSIGRYRRSVIIVINTSCAAIGEREYSNAVFLCIIISFFSMNPSKTVISISTSIIGSSSSLDFNRKDFTQRLCLHHQYHRYYHHRHLRWTSCLRFELRNTNVQRNTDGMGILCLILRDSSMRPSNTKCLVIPFNRHFVCMCK